MIVVSEAFENPSGTAFRGGPNAGEYGFVAVPLRVSLEHKCKGHVFGRARRGDEMKGS
jgi:hypothetical protein